MSKIRNLFASRHNVASYSKMQTRFYKSGTSDHLEHNDNQDYWGILLEGVSDTQCRGGHALDCACGKGRNVKNLLSLAR